jgi:hypothetical protein
MANKDAPFGLKPIRYASGAPYNGAANVYAVLDTQNRIGVGSVVSYTGTAVAGTPQVARSEFSVTTPADNTPVVGVVVGVADNEDGTVFRENDRWVESGEASFVMVADDPNLLFAVQEDGNLGNAGVGAHFTIGFGTFNTQYAFATDEIISSSAVTNATNNLRPFQVVRLYREPENAVGTNAVWEGIIVNHANRPGGGATSA